MHPIGFSTGALALADFRLGVQLQREFRCDAIELSALRENELEPLLQQLAALPLQQFRHISFHAPSSLEELSESELVERLMKVADLGWPIVVHPNTITQANLWRRLGGGLLIENLDHRAQTGRSPKELYSFFQQLPEARWCFDLAHAWQIDRTMGLAIALLDSFRDRLAEIHISELSDDYRHVPMTVAAMIAYRQVANLVSDDVPVIIESVVSRQEMSREFDMAQRSLMRCGIGSSRLETLA